MTLRRFVRTFFLLYTSSGLGERRSEERKDQLRVSDCKSWTDGATRQQHQEADVRSEKTLWSGRYRRQHGDFMIIYCSKDLREISCSV